jgi:DNA-directed RNA polymerase III subunit RPC8
MFYLDVGEIVRFRVETEEWHDQIPNAPDLGEDLPTDRKPAYSIFVSCFSFSGVLFYEPSS